MCKTYVPYKGPALPGNAEVVVLFSSTTAFGSRAAPHYNVYFVDVSITADQAAGTQTVKLQRSIDGGTTWADVPGSSTNVGTAIVPASFYVGVYRDFRVVYTNGTTPQTTFDVELVLDHESRGSVAQA